MLKNKKVLLMMFLSILILIFSTNCFASSTNTISFTAISSFTNETKREYKNIELPSSVGKYFVIDIDNNNYIDCFYSDNEITMSEDGYLYSEGLQRVNCSLNDFISNSNNWRGANVNGYYSCCNFIYLNDTKGQPAKILTASSSILNSDGTIFFRVAPQVLAQQVEKVATGQVLQEIIQLLPTILVVVVSFLGLRKALRMLLKLLRQS